MIRKMRSFKIVEIKDLSFVVNSIESEIEAQKLRCRVYTEHRAAVIAGVAVPTGITQLAGIATALGIGVHNLATINPDYEIAKNIVTNTVTVNYKK